MSEKCPLCGNIRLEDSIFCADCAKKVQSDYEVVLPENIDNLIEPNDETKNENDSDLISDSNSDTDTDSDSNSNSVPISDNDVNCNYEINKYTFIADDSAANDILKEKKNYKYETTTANDIIDDVDFVSDDYPKKSSKKGKTLLRTIIVVLILIGVYFVFYEVVLEKNLERSAWETAIKENSVIGYLTYIEKHPSGIHFNEAQEGLMSLKRTEASAWESLKKSENISELTNFISQYDNSPYIPLVEARLDSLSWIVSLKTNSAESYYEYIEFSRHGSLKGDYVAEAQKRYDLLYQSTPVEDNEIDSIRTTVSGFYSALSSLDHAGMYNFLDDHVQRFFDSGGISRERITGELVMTAAQTDNSRINFAPVLDGVQYRRSGNGFYEVNAPLIKSYSEDNKDILIPGYIVHISLNPDFKIRSIYETKPFSGAP